MSPPDGTTTTTTGTEGTSAAATAAAATAATAATGANGTTTGTTTTGTTGTTAATTATTAEPGKWADDWRKTMAKGDEAAVKRLERYKDPESVFEALVNAQKKIDSGQIKPTLPENATPEQVAEYRKALGVPESHDKYDTVIAEGHVWGEADKPMLESFTKAAHAANLPPEAVKTALKWYGDLAKAKAEQQQTNDATHRTELIATLGKEYGGDFNRNIAHIDSYLNDPSFPPEVKTMIYNARGPDGRLLRHNAQYMDYLYKEALFKNPIATVMGGNSEANVKAAEARMEELRKMSGDRKSEYYTGPKETRKIDGMDRTETKMQWEYYDLINQTEKIKAANKR